MNSDDIVDVFTSLTRLMVDALNQVNVTLRQGGTDTSVIQVQVAPEDIGKIVGVQGRTARALRVLLVAVSHASKQRYTLDIVQAPKAPEETA